MSTATKALRSSTWGTLRHPQFKALAASGGIYFVGNAMQTMAASWMMAQISNSSCLGVLVQTAVFLPMFILALPAGVWADIADRRRLILTSLYVQMGAGVLLTVLMLFHVGGPGTLLFMIFVIGCCVALLSPAWNSALTQSVPRQELPQAITVVSIAYNAARAVGPTLAGLVFLLGGAWNFGLAVLSTIVMAWAVKRNPPKPHPPTRLPPERLWGGMVSALRFARHSHNVLAQLVRTVAYSAAGSALWALLPSIGKQQLELGASGFGLLMGCLGGGAVAVGFLIGRIRQRFDLEAIIKSSCVCYALMMLITAWSTWDWPLYPALVLAGAAWMAPMSTFNTATQTSVPPWVRARAAALHTVCALGSFAIGSAIWGALADLMGLAQALTLAAIAMFGGLLLAKPFPLRMGEAPEVTQAEAWEKVFITNEPAPDKGPIAVENIYRIEPAQSAQFVDTLSELRAIRRRDGATLWRIYSDLADPTRYVERFIVESWAAYLHQQARMTLADLELEAKVKAFQAEGVPIITQHFLAEG